MGLCLTSSLVLTACQRSCSGSVSGTAQLGSASAGSARAVGLTHGVSSGELQATQAVLWARGSGPGYLHVEVEGGGVKRREKARFRPARDMTARIALTGLLPATEYNVRAWADADALAGLAPKTLETARFRTAPRATQAAALSFAWGGDLGGQNVCRDKVDGYPVFKAIRDAEPAFFIELGDMIYADGTCDAVGRFGNAQLAGSFPKAAKLESYWAHWRYNRADPGYQDLLAGAGRYSVWDDHEVVNDFAPSDDVRSDPPYSSGVHLLPLGRQAFVDWASLSDEAESGFRFYRSARWGKHLELFFLDTRQYRDAKLKEDSPKKTMLGQKQLEWLEKSLQGSDATWKVIVTSVPLSIPTGWPPEAGRDGWASFDGKTGYREELQRVFDLVAAAKPRNIVFLTTDVHFGSGFSYRPLAEDESFQLWEFVAGPLAAGLYPKREFDSSFGAERLFFFGPAEEDTPATYAAAKKWFNFGFVEVAADGKLSVTLRDVEGKVVAGQVLTPAP